MVLRQFADGGICGGGLVVVEVQLERRRSTGLRGGQGRRRIGAVGKAAKRGENRDSAGQI